MDPALATILVAIVTAAGSIIGVVVTNHSANKRMTKQVETLEKHSKNQYLAILRLTVMSKEMPISERIIAGKEYIDRGGNGDVKLFYENFLKEHTK